MQLTSANGDYNNLLSGVIVWPELLMILNVAVLSRFVTGAALNHRSTLGVFGPVPEFLYKYRPHDSFSESWILKEQLYLASPSQFNDPFDSKVLYSAEGTPDQKKRFIAQVIHEPYPNMPKRKVWTMVKNAMQKQALEQGLDRIQKRIDEYGVVSFSEEANNIVVFAYYAKNHTGYCLRYKWSSESPLSMVQRVNYSHTYPNFSMFDMDVKKKV